jgi:hypothetical protein
MLSCLTHTVMLEQMGYRGAGAFSVGGRGLLPQLSRCACAKGVSETQFSAAVIVAFDMHEPKTLDTVPSVGLPRQGSFLFVAAHGSPR